MRTLTFPNNGDNMPDQEPDAELLDDETCPTCGSLPDAPDGDKCWECRACGGMYSSGTEQCDWCPDEKHCSQTYMGLA